MLGPQALFRFRPASGPRPFPVCLLTPARGRGPAHVEHVHRRPGPTGSGRFLSARGSSLSHLGSVSSYDRGFHCELSNSHTSTNEIKWSLI
jgi:hypothetical protein